MSRFSSFSIPQRTNEGFQKKLKDKEQEIISKFSKTLHENNVLEFLKIIQESKKSFKTLLEDPLKELKWSDDLYMDIYNMVLKVDSKTIEKILSMYSMKFRADEMPINYLTSILRSNLNKIQMNDSLIDQDLKTIKEFIVQNISNKDLTKREVQKKFLELNLKVSKMTIDSETKTTLNQKVNESHRKFQEWIKTI